MHVRFDTRYDWSAVTAAADGLRRHDQVEPYSGGNSLQDYGKVWQTGGAPANGTFLVSAISARTYAVFEFDNAKYTSLVAGGTDQTIALAAARGTRMSNAAGSTDLQHRPGLRRRGRARRWRTCASPSTASCRSARPRPSTSAPTPC